MTKPVEDSDYWRVVAAAAVLLYHSPGLVAVAVSVAVDEVAPVAGSSMLFSRTKPTRSTGQQKSKPYCTKTETGTRTGTEDTGTGMV